MIKPCIAILVIGFAITMAQFGFVILSNDVEE